MKNLYLLLFILGCAEKTCPPLSAMRATPAACSRLALLSAGAIAAPTAGGPRGAALEATISLGKLQPTI